MVCSVSSDTITQIDNPAIGDNPTEDGTTEDGTQRAIQPQL